MWRQLEGKISTEQKNPEAITLSLTLKFVQPVSSSHPRTKQPRQRTGFSPKFYASRN